MQVSAAPFNAVTDHVRPIFDYLIAFPSLFSYEYTKCVSSKSNLQIESKS